MPMLIKCIGRSQGAEVEYVLIYMTGITLAEPGGYLASRAPRTLFIAWLQIRACQIKTCGWSL
jgi:hypothetical protein